MGLKECAHRAPHARGHASARPGVPDPLPAPSVPRTASPRAVARAGLPAPDLQELEAEASYHGDRLALHRPRVLSAKPASAARLAELPRTSAVAPLRHAARPDVIAAKEQ